MTVVPGGPAPRVTVLNVDDNEAIRYAKTRTLQRAGYRVLEAETGAEALRLVEQEDPALVLLDVKLPDINGIEVCRRIKSMRPHMLVLQISASFVTTADKVAGLDAGADSYLTQPVEPDELTAAVGALLRMRAAEEALRRANETLEARVEERTRDLDAANRQLRDEIAEREQTEAQLRQAQKMEIVGQLTGGIAHDFNNLLQIVVGSLDAARRKLPASAGSVAPLLENASIGAERAAALTRRLLAFTRREPLSPKPVDVNEVLGGMRDIVRQSVGEQVTVEYVLDETAPVVWSDHNQLENALLNLVVNARDAMTDGGRLTLRTSSCLLTNPIEERRPELGAGEYVCLSVEDTGSGMTSAVLSRVFDPFYTTKPVGQGTGLGLSMVYGFAKQSRGHVDIRSAPGQGTSVTIMLPRHAGGASVVRSEPAADALPHGRGEVVLVVEDEELVRTIMTEALSDAGFACIEASDADEALAALRSRDDIEVMVTDVGLPGMDGRRLAKQARAQSPDLKLIFATGHAVDADEDFSDDDVELLVKPFNTADLARAVGQMVTRAKVVV